VSQFVDEAEIRIEAGAGGHGLIAFRREKYVPRGGPCGGDGGRGGSVIVEADPNLHTLLDLRYRQRIRAPRGQHGQGSSRTGKSGEDVIVRVPMGTEVADADSGEVLGDLTEPGQRLMAARGGRGGRGNERFATSTHQSPQVAEDGGPGEARRVRFTLKLFAEVGLVGQPNAGKSTLLAALSAARPKVADYPFTTLTPHLGIVRVGEYGSFVMADIPGLIEGASRGKGLGHRFLRHLERTRVLLFLVDALDPEPDRTLEGLRGEMLAYSEGFADKPWRVALTKIDLLGEGKPPGLSRLREKPYMISAHANRGLGELTSALFALLESIPLRRQESGESGAETG